MSFSHYNPMIIVNMTITKVCLPSSTTHLPHKCPVEMCPAGIIFLIKTWNTYDMNFAAVEADNNMAWHAGNNNEHCVNRYLPSHHLYTMKNLTEAYFGFGLQFELNNCSLGRHFWLFLLFWSEAFWTNNSIMQKINSGVPDLWSVMMGLSIFPAHFLHMCEWAFPAWRH